MKIKNIFACLIFAFSVSGCSYLYDTFVYQIDVTQGNYIEDDKLKKLTIGMTQEQVIFVLGSPMLIDQFNSSKWYYIRYIKPGGEEAQQSKIILTFNNKKLANIFSENTDQKNPLIKESKNKNEPNEVAENGETKTPVISQ